MAERDRRSSKCMSTQCNSTRFGSPGSVNVFQIWRDYLEAPILMHVFLILSSNCSKLICSEDQLIFFVFLICQRNSVLLKQTVQNKTSWENRSLNGLWIIKEMNRLFPSFISLCGWRATRCSDKNGEYIMFVHSKKTNVWYAMPLPLPGYYSKCCLEEMKAEETAS